MSQQSALAFCPLCKNIVTPLLQEDGALIRMCNTKCGWKETLNKPTLLYTESFDVSAHRKDVSVDAILNDPTLMVLDRHCNGVCKTIRRHKALRVDTDKSMEFVYVCMKCHAKTTNKD